MSTLGNFVWSIADQLRGVYRPHQYGGIILPFTILRRLDCLLSPTRDEIRALAEQFDGGAWPALATVLAGAEAGGHKPHHLLKEAAAQRELDTARQTARGLITRIQHTGRNPVPNRRAEAVPPWQQTPLPGRSRPRSP